LHYRSKNKYKVDLALGAYLSRLFGALPLILKLKFVDEMR